MNAVHFGLLESEFRKQLKVDVARSPDNYPMLSTDTASKFAKKWADKILDSMANGGHNKISYDTDVFKRTCEALGIEHSAKSVLMFVGIPFRI